jgi:hypothetical protein
MTVEERDIIVDEEVLIYGLRYCLGRHTYATAIMAETTESNLSKLSTKCLFVMARDIVEFLEGVEQSKIKSEIDAIDNRTWANLAKTIIPKLPKYFTEANPQAGFVVKFFLNRG